MRPALLLAAAVVAAGLAPAAAAQGGGMPSYEPQQRLRTALDTCNKSEVVRNAYCVKKCEDGFRMDLSGPKPRCVGLRPDAKYTPPVPAFKPGPAHRPPPNQPG